MPSTLEYVCQHCACVLNVTTKHFGLGPQRSTFETGAYAGQEAEYLEWVKANTKTSYCHPCGVSLVLPLRLSPYVWTEWKRTSIKCDHPYVDYPFLVSLVARIDERISEAPGAVIDLDPVACPYCNQALSPEPESSPSCPRCGVADMKLVGQSIVTFESGKRWPPII